MKYVTVCLIVVLSVALCAWADDGWLTDLAKAQAEAKTEKKLVLIDFNGSDWCPGCQALRKEVFSSPAFREYAKQHLVLVDVDFPHKKRQPKSLKKANEALADKFEVEGLPTIVVLGSDGKELEKKSGYEGESPKQFIADLEKLQTKR